MNHKLKKLFIIILALLVLITNNLSLVSYASAQTNSPSPTPTSTPAVNLSQTPIPTSTPTLPASGEPSSTPSITIAPSGTPIPSSSVQPTTHNPQPTSIPPTPLPTEASTKANILPSITPTIIPSLSPSAFDSSAKIRQSLKLLPLSKINYRSDEKVNLRLLNATSRIKVTIKHIDGSSIPLIMSKSQSAEETQISLTPLSSFKPGKYIVTVNDENGQSVIQDFTWGVIAINTNKSIYLPGETVDFQMSTLNEHGTMVCDAGLTLVITSPGGTTKILSTEDQTIFRNPQCEILGYVDKPDYEAQYQLNDELGTYQLLLKAVTQNGEFQISDSFQVKKSVPFSVERKSVTRLFPPLTYQMIFDIKADQDFNGEIKEKIPSGFTITPIEDPTIVPYSQTSTQSAQIQPGGSVLGVSQTRLRYPFDGQFPISLGFTEIPDNIFLQQEYEKGGFIGHDGTDFAMPIGTPIYASDDGTVTHVGYGPYGKTVIITHDWGKTYYGHLSIFRVEIGQRVKKDDLIALSGSTGFSTGPHLHFVVRPDNQSKENGYGGAVNALAYLNTDNSDILGTSASSDALSETILTWNISLTKGQSIKIGYQFKAPRQTPQFYLLGPLQFYQIVNLNLNPLTDQSSGLSFDNIPGLTTYTPSLPTSIYELRTPNYELVFQEARHWQLAADAEVLIDSTPTTTDRATETSAANKVFISHQVGYVFYLDSNSQCVYSKTIDGGTTWESAVGLDSQTDCTNIAVWYDRWTPGDDEGTNIHIVIQDSGTDDLWYIVLNTNNDSLSTSISISSSPAPAETSLFSSTDTRPAITKGTDGDIYAGSPDPGTSFIHKCESSCTTASNWTNTNATHLAENDDNDYILFPLLNNNIMLIVADDGTDDVEYDIYNDTTGSWGGSMTDIQAANAIHNTWEGEIGATIDKISNNVYVVFPRNTSTIGGGNDEIRAYAYDGSSWTAKTSVVSSESRGITHAKIAIDEATGDLYAIYSAQPTAGASPINTDMFYKVSTDGMTSWSSETQLNSTTAEIGGIDVNIMSDERIHVTWFLGSTTDDLYGNTALDSQNKSRVLHHGEWLNVGRHHSSTF